MIILTTTKEKAQKIIEANKELEFFNFPCIEYTEPEDSYKALDQAIRLNHTYEWIFFLSQKAAETYFERLLAIGGNFFNLSNHLKFAVIGKTTKDFFENEINMPVDFMPSKANSKTFIEEFCTKYKYEFECAFKVLLPRSQRACDDFKEELEKSKNYVLDIVPAYNNLVPSYSEKDLNLYREKIARASSIVFSSTSAVENFVKLLAAYDLKELKVFSIGPKTSAALEKIYPGLAYTEAQEANFEALLKACV